MKQTRRQTDGRPTWRQYQESLARPQRRTALIRVMGIGFAMLLAGAGLVAAAVSLFNGPAQPAGLPPGSASPSVFISTEAASKELLLSKGDVALLLGRSDPQIPLAKDIQVAFNSQAITLETSIDPELQDALLNRMDRKNSRYIGIVVMDAETGQVKALAGYNKREPTVNPCLVGKWPAASIFKIVTAAAAVDHMGYTADTILTFNGYKHTLYKRQLTETRNRYTNRISFKHSFAQSVNPVFGKIGTLYLKKEKLDQFANTFGFNQPIDFEFPVDRSHITVHPKSYHWAEIASGFNHDTTISPLHGAMMASAVVNQGRMVAPTIVDRITDADGNLLYRSRKAWSGKAMSAKAANVLQRLMEATVQSGTGRKSFRDRRRHRILSKLTIGGKTGSIFNRAHDARFDWFVGYASEKKGTARLAVSVLVAHEEYIGIRATQYARTAMAHYFERMTAHRKNAGSNSKG